MRLELHPALPLALAMALGLFLPARLRRVATLLGAGIATGLMFWLPEGSGFLTLLGRTWVVLRVDALGRLFALAFALYTAVASLYAWSDTHRAQLAAGAGLGAAGVGVCLAGDLLTLFVFWEWLTFSSLWLIFSGGRGALAAGGRYLIFHAVGGMCLFAGVVALDSAGAPLSVGPLALDRPAAWLILAGLATNAAIPPLHAWLPDAYPEATPAGTVFLSAFTTKAAVYALLRVFPGAELLVWAGAAMTLYGVLFAVLENDIRRLLGYHIISQVGYMVAGAGLGTTLAVNGSAAHAFSHIFYKGLLMMAAGAILHATGRSKLSELGALGRQMPWVLAMFAVGALSISGAPLLNGFVSKAMVVSAAAMPGYGAVELMLNVASMGTFLSIGCKVTWFAFYGEDRGAAVQRPVPPSMFAAMLLAALVCAVTGVAPSLLYRLLPQPVDYAPYTLAHVVGALQLLVGTALGFWILRAKFAGPATVTRDVDRFYRDAAPALVNAAGAALAACGQAGDRVVAWLLGGAWPSLRQRIESAGRPDKLGVEVAILAVVLVSVGIWMLWR